MTTNFFDLIDGIFRGFILFLYNAVVTLFALFRHPLRAPVARYRSYVNEKELQIGPWTILMLAFAVMFVMPPSFWGNTPLEEARNELPNWLSNGGQSKLFLRIGIEGVVAAVVVDAILRLIVWTRFPKASVAARTRTVGIVEYAAALVPGSVIFSCSIIKVVQLAEIEFEVLGLAILAIAAILLAASAVPAARLAIRIGMPSCRGRLLRWFCQALGTVIVLLACFGGVWMGDSVGRAIEARDDADKVVAAADERRLQIVALNCIRETKRWRYTVVVWNNTPRPIFPRKELHRITVGEDVYETEGHPTFASDVVFDPPPGAIDGGLAPGNMASFTGTFIQPADWTGKLGTHCYFGETQTPVNDQFKGDVKVADQARRP